MIHDNWHDPVIEGFIDDMEVFGVNLRINNIRYRGFGSQGDGASFVVSSTMVDTPIFVEAMLGELPEHLEKLRQPIDWDFKFGLSFSEYHDKGLESLTYPEWKVLKLALGGKSNNYLDLSSLISLWVKRIDDRYAHENTVSAEIEPEWLIVYDDEEEDILHGGTIHNSNEEEYTRFVEALSTTWHKFVKAACKKLYKDLKDYYEELQREERLCIK